MRQFFTRAVSSVEGIVSGQGQIDPAAWAAVQSRWLVSRATVETAGCIGCQHAECTPNLPIDWLHYVRKGRVVTAHLMPCTSPCSRWCNTGTTTGKTVLEPSAHLMPRTSACSRWCSTGTQQQAQAFHAPKAIPMCPPDAPYVSIPEAAYSRVLLLKPPARIVFR